MHDHEMLEKAREKVSSALVDYLDAAGFMHEGELMSAWGAVIHITPVEDMGRSIYVSVFNSPSSPAHVAFGLFHEGIRLTEDHGSYHRPEDD